MLFVACINSENASRQKSFLYFIEKYFTNTKPVIGNSHIRQGGSENRSWCKEDDSLYCTK